MNRTYSAKPSEIERKWFVVDATGVPVGRLAGQVAKILRGKHKPTFTYNQDCGDFVIVINADRVVLTGRKENELIHWHTGWPGGLRNVSRGKLLADDPVQLVEKVIWGMTPKTKLGKQIFSKLKVYAGEDHPHAAQKPELIKLTK
ncbi:MAG: 50S ribosomal protein L13 [Chthonomonas sp.]|nr:50S ribosomal protein L13 [Chthonomonas sp.]